MRTGIFHHVGTFLLLVATILLLIASISSPVVNNLSILRVRVAVPGTVNTAQVDFGTFGYCVRIPGSNIRAKDFYCTNSHIGYDPLKAMTLASSYKYSDDPGHDTARALTNVLVLHPVACGLAFIAFLLALGSGFIGALFAAAMSLLAFIVTVIVLAVDFTLFGIVRNSVRRDNKTLSTAVWGPAVWTTLVAMLVLLLATIVILFTCCSARLHKKRAMREGKHADGYRGTTTTTTRTHKRRFWQRRTRY